MPRKWTEDDGTDKLSWVSGDPGPRIAHLQKEKLTAFCLHFFIFLLTNIIAWNIFSFSKFFVGVYSVSTVMVSQRHLMWVLPCDSTIFTSLSPSLPFLATPPPLPSFLFPGHLPYTFMSHIHIYYFMFMYRRTRICTWQKHNVFSSQWFILFNVMMSNYIHFPANTKISPLPSSLLSSTLLPSLSLLSVLSLFWQCLCSPT